jgi:replicative DNA helicase
MTVTQLSEAATLGGLLLRPKDLDPIRLWLRAGDFADPWHEQLYALLREKQIAQEPINPEAVGMDLLERVGPRRADLVRIVGVLQSTPAHAEPAVYGRMVLESSLRREVAMQGVLLRACALSASLNHSSRPLTVGLAMVDQALREGEGRWQLASGESSFAPTTHPELAPALRNPHRFLAADRLVSAHPQLDVEEGRLREQQTVAALICHPGQLPEVRSWLRPELLTDKRWRVAYEALLDLVDAGTSPVDAVTVSWQIQRSTRRLGRGPEPYDLVRAVDSSLSNDPSYCARRVAENVVRRTADSSARLLKSAADNPGLEVPELYETARVGTAALLVTAGSLDGAKVRGAHLQAVPELAERVREAVGPVAG